MNLRHRTLAPILGLLLAMGCGARSPLDTLDDESAWTAGGSGGNLGSGGAGNFPPGGGTVGNTGGSGAGGGIQYGGAGGQAGFGPGGSPMGGMGGTGGTRIGGTVVGGRGGTMITGGRINTGGSAGGAAGTIRLDGGFGGGAGVIGRDGGGLDLRRGGASGNADSGLGDAFGRLDSGGSTCQGLASNEEMIDDLNDGDQFIPLLSGRAGAWAVSHDGSPNAKMFPDPSTGFASTSTGDACRKYAAYVYGGIYVLWGASFRFGLGGPYDASKYNGISFWAKADAGTSSVLRVAFPDKDTQPDGNLCQTSVSSGPTACYDHYGYRVTLTTTWTKYTVRFNQLAQESWGRAGNGFDPASLYEVLFQIPVNTTFAIWIDDVAFTM